MRLLVCDDEDDIRSLVSTAVQALTTHEVVGAAGSAGEALALAAAAKADVIVTDSMASPASSADYLRALRAAAPDAAIIVFSGFLQRTLPPGSPYDEFVLKGDGVRRLLDAIEAAGDGGVVGQNPTVGSSGP